MTSITTLLKNILMLNYYLTNRHIYEEFFKHKNFLTLAIFQKAKFYGNQNEMVVGKMKDEYKGIPINIFVGLK